MTEDELVQAMMREGTPREQAEEAAAIAVGALDGDVLEPEGRAPSPNRANNE